MITIAERLQDQQGLFKQLVRMAGLDIRVAMPGIIQAFDDSTQTATVQVAIREKVLINGNEEWTEIPLLVDVPVLFPRAGGYSITFPVTGGDECLVIFSDCCYDAFWQSGSVQNQVDYRRHDLSDGMAILSGISQPNRLGNVSAGGLQIRSDSGGAVIELAGDTVNIRAAALNINVGSYSLTADSSTSDGGGSSVIDGKHFLSHKHSGVQSGGSSTGGVA